MPYDWINKQKSNQNWLRKEGEKFLFPGGGTMFPHGVSAYVDLMTDLIPEMKDGTVRTAIDTGCGVSPTFSSILCFLQQTMLVTKPRDAIFAFRGNFIVYFQQFLTFHGHLRGSYSKLYQGGTKKF